MFVCHIDAHSAFRIAAETSLVFRIRVFSRRCNTSCFLSEKVTFVRGDLISILDLYSPPPYHVVDR